MPLVPSIDVSLLPKFEDVIPKDELSGSPTSKSEEHEIYFIPGDAIPNHPNGPIDFSSWGTCFVGRTINNILVEIRGRILSKRGRMMKSDKH